MSKRTSLLVMLFFLLLAWGAIGFASPVSEEVTLEERVAAIEATLNQMNERLSSIETRMDTLNNRLDTLNTRFDDLIATFNDRLDNIFTALSNRLDTLNNELDDSISGLRVRMDTQFMWILGFIGLTWATVVGSILATVFTRKS